MKKEEKPLIEKWENFIDEHSIHSKDGFLIMIQPQTLKDIIEEDLEKLFDELLELPLSELPDLVDTRDFDETINFVRSKILGGKI